MSRITPPDRNDEEAEENLDKSLLMGGVAAAVGIVAALVKPS
jgi:hypothetical protein